ncbi:MAG: hypothetical protein AB1341_14850, partial [Bacillota bacterium]
MEKLLASFANQKVYIVLDNLKTHLYSNVHPYLIAGAVLGKAPAAFAQKPFRAIPPSSHLGSEILCKPTSSHCHPSQTLIKVQTRLKRPSRNKLIIMALPFFKILYLHCIPGTKAIPSVAGSIFPRAL